MDRRDLERLGHHVVSRRVALGYRNRTDLAGSLQFTLRTLADIEHGVRKASPGTYAILENKLAWAPGSIDTILAGGEPQEPCPTCTAPPPTRRPTTASPNALSHGPPRSCCWSYDAASSTPATDATIPGTIGTAAWTRTATGPNRASQPGLQDPGGPLMHGIGPICGGGRRDGRRSKLVVLVDELCRVVGVISIVEGVRLDVKRPWMPLQLLHATVSALRKRMLLNRDHLPTCVSACAAW